VPHPRILYEYDFGDSWRHWIEFEEQVPRDDATKYPICVDGARHCPPEDVGGPHGYADFLKAWRDPTHQEHRAMRTWAGRAFDPETFDIAKANKAIAASDRMVRWRDVRRTWCIASAYDPPSGLGERPGEPSDGE
jgi:Plasmid pRiA4b ORF-3-like protein